MPRLKLIHIPNGIYSVVSKCNNDEFLFDAKEKFEMYIEHLLECKKVFGFLMYDIVCMSNHIHELYRVPGDVTIAQILQRVKGQFSKKFNKKYGRSCHFWKNKPYYRIVENERYALCTMNYFHWNPVKAGLVRKPCEWPFSGYRFHILGDKSGKLGQLLDSIDSKTITVKEYPLFRQAQEIFKGQKGRFLGSDQFQSEMRKRYGKCRTLNDH